MLWDTGHSFLWVCRVFLNTVKTPWWSSSVLYQIRVMSRPHSIPMHPPQGRAWHPSAITTSACGEGPSPGYLLAILWAHILTAAAFRSWSQKLKWTHVWRQFGMLERAGRGGRRHGTHGTHGLPGSGGLQAVKGPGCSTSPLTRPQLHIKANNKNCSVKLPDFYFCLSKLLAPPLIIGIYYWAHLLPL